MKSTFKGKKILITGGTGSLGKALTRKLLELDADTVRIFSRDEVKQIEMSDEIKDGRTRFLIGDVRDKERLRLAMEDIDIVFHAAALKQVPVAEYNPFEAVKTNVLGSQNVVDVCREEEVEIAMAVSSDKAVSPLNTYGATKLVMEKIFTAANFYKGWKKTIFTAVRYGNVMGSRGSVLPQFVKAINNSGSITITNPEMTRFNITLSDALDLILGGVERAKGAEIFVPKLQAYKLGELAEAVTELMGKDVKVIRSSIRPGEKMHEMLINDSESDYTIESDSRYVLLSPMIYQDHVKLYSKPKTNCIKGAYSSDKVPLISKSKLKELIKREIFDASNKYRP